MAEPIPPPIQSAVLAVLRAVKEAGLRAVNRTSLVKFVYLLDCLHAEQQAGQTASASHWYFDKFGPFATDLVAGIDRMAEIGLIEAREGSHGNKDFVLYRLGEYPQGPALTDVGLSHHTAGRMGQWVRKFSGDLPKLLDFVYFHTEPMRAATPGNALSFASLATHHEVGRYEPVHVADQKRLFRLLELSNKMGQTFRASLAAQQANARTPTPYDAVYTQAMTAFDEQDDVEPLTFDAELPS